MGDNLFRTRLASAIAVAALAAAPALAESRLDQVLDTIIENERRLAEELTRYKPLVETYIQTVKPDPELGPVPVKDNYFLGRLDLASIEIPEEEARTKKAKKSKKKSLSLFDDFHSQTFKPESFAKMLIVDRGSFDRDHYEFEFVRAEFQGEVRTLVFDVKPREGKPLNRLKTGRFTGRIWVEDREFRIVRFNGIYTSAFDSGFHFDSWRLNMGPGLWLPAYVYTEEPDRAYKQLKLTHKGQTRIWGYSVKRADAEEEFTKVLIDEALTKDSVDQPGQFSPVESARSWEAEAEENVIRRLERAGLLAPEGEVDQVLQTVVTNLEITNELNIQPPVRCRVLLTTPLESFTVGHTIVVSRGLIDVLPDEASLAVVLGHELGHILSGHELDTRYAFSDSILVGDRQAMDEFLFQRDPLEDVEADSKAMELLQSSPYKDDLATAGLFLKALGERADDLSSLIRPHFGNRMLKKGALYWMSPIADSAPELDHKSIEQIAALPLGGRVKVSPWTARIELMKNNRVPLLSAREKMPFQVTPIMPYLARLRGDSPELAEIETNDTPKEQAPRETVASERR